VRQIFDEIRSLWVAATPEEVARQSWLHKMTKSLRYPPGLIAIEKEISPLRRRVDILCYTPDAKPLLLLECKAGPLTPKAMEQVLGYNFHIQAPYVAIVNAAEIHFRYNLACKRGLIHHLPTYQELIDECCLSTEPE